MKKRKYYSLPLEILLTLISAFVYALAFPSFLNENGFAPLAFIALIPMIYALNKTKWIYTPLLGFIFGVSYLAIFNYWLSTFHPLAIVIGPVAKGIQLLLFFPILKLSYTFPKKYKAISQSIVYVLYSYVVQQGFLGYAYGSLASSTITLPIIAQLASLTGIWGISFLMFIPQSFIANYFIDNKNLIFSKYLEFKKDGIFLYFFIILCVFIYGISSLNYWKYKTPDKYVKIATIQHNADTWEGGYNQYKNNFETLSKLTNEAMKLEPDLVMWSETAFVPSVAWHTNYPRNIQTSNLVEDFIEFGKSLDVPLITGNVEGVLKDIKEAPFLEDGSWNRDDYNTIILFSDGKLEDTYRKQHLVPFTEYFPYEKQFPKFYQYLKAHDYHWWLPSNESKVFDFNGVKFSTSICFEDIFSDLSREFVLNGSTLLLNLSNDSWSKSIAAEQQHMNLGAFRAIENRKSVVRSTNSGITCLITAWGEVIQPITPFTEDYRVYNVPIYDNNKENMSFYTKHGNYFIFIAALVVIAYLIFRLFYFIVIKTKNKISNNNDLNNNDLNNNDLNNNDLNNNDLINNDLEDTILVKKIYKIRKRRKNYTKRNFIKNNSIRRITTIVYKKY